MRQLLLLSLFAFACGSSSDDEGEPGNCPNLSGTWTVAEHCDASLIGASAPISMKSCSLTFSAPFDGFSASVSEDGAVSVSGPQTCTGNATQNTITLDCTPGDCSVTLTK
jgi:hypothetical protein